MTIYYYRRPADFWAGIHDDPTIPGPWSAGKTVEEAVADLVRCHPEKFTEGYTVEAISEERAQGHRDWTSARALVAGMGLLGGQRWN